jgi:hypothetical protein
MGLLNGLMPGEWSPNGMGGQSDKMSGLLNNPALQMGLGILANNQGNYGSFGAALGRGGLTGMQNLQRQQESMRQQELMKLRNKQFEQEYGMKQAEFEQNKTKNDQQEAAHNDFDTKFPEYKGLSRLNPQAAMKIAYPQATGADPYFTPIPLDSGLARFNNRTGEMELVTLPNGQTAMKASDSPSLQGRIQGAKSQAQAQWKPNDMIPGTISTDAQVAGAARGGFPASAQGRGYTWNGQSMGAPGTTQTDAMEGDANIQLRDPARPQRSALGLSVPTPAELAGDAERAKKLASGEVDSNINAKNAIKKSDQLLSAAEEAKALLNQGPTGSGIGANVDSVNRFFGKSTKSGNVATKLETLSGWMVSNVPRMEGPQSNFDVENYKVMAGKVGDRTAPVKERLDALDTLVKLQEKYKSLNQDTLNGSNIMPTNEVMPKAAKMFDELPKPNQFKGKIIRDDVTGKRFQSNGLQWKEVK